jgi:hypothetical protein
MDIAMPPRTTPISTYPGPAPEPHAVSPSSSPKGIKARGTRKPADDQKALPQSGLPGQSSLTNRIKN